MSLHPLSITHLLSNDKVAIGFTWFILALENMLMALIPLFIGLSIDGLLIKDFSPLGFFALIMAILIVISVARRMYDTRVYGQMKVKLGRMLTLRQHGTAVSVNNTRHNLARELVDFLETDLPDVFSSVIQITISAIVLFSVHQLLGWSALALLVSMLLIYAMGHGHFYRFNAGINSQMEQQVHLLSQSEHTQGRQYGAFYRHLTLIKRWEVKLSDMEAWIYGCIFLLVGLFICYNLWVGARLPAISAGQLFTIISYSWEFASAGIALPMALQSWTRLQEISARLNQPVDSIPSSPSQDAGLSHCNSAETCLNKSTLCEENPWL